MNVAQLVAQAGGVATTRTLFRSGARAHHLRQATLAGALIRPRRGWYALPSIDSDLHRAVRSGVIITCISRAKRLGLWVRIENELHVAAPARNARVHAERCRVHWGAPLEPRAPDCVEDSVVNTLNYVAQCQPFERALVIWESALNKRLTALEVLNRLPLSKSARELAAHSTPFADSGLETTFFARLKFLPVRITPQAWVLGHRVDFLIGDRLVVQLDGATHAGAQRTQDIRHDSELRLRGYSVFRFSYSDVIDDWPSVQSRVMSAVAQGLHLASDG